MPTRPTLQSFIDEELLRVPMTLFQGSGSVRVLAGWQSASSNRTQLRHTGA